MTEQNKFLTDSYGRRIDYLRISLTDKCNLRCFYCMPKEGVTTLEHSEIMTLEEIHRVAGLLTKMGIRKIRFTGGEPLVRKNIISLIRMVSELPNPPELSITTNGVALMDYLDEFIFLGVGSINVSLDTLNRDTYKRIAGVDALDKVLSSIDSAIEKGFAVKMNTVLIRGTNDSEAEELVTFARDRGIDIRFIELMPLGCAKNLEGIPGDEILERLEEKFGQSEECKYFKESIFESDDEVDEGKSNLKIRKVEIDEGKSNLKIRKVEIDEEKKSPGIVKEEIKYVGPARYYRFPGFKNKVGFINPMTHNFCSECNRIRLTVDGRLKLCLYYPDGLDVKKLMRDGCTDEELEQKLRDAILQKPQRHEFMNNT